MTKHEFLERFQLHQLVDYHTGSKSRTEHLERSSLREASVLIGLVERPSGLHVILTKRANHLKHHPGQISFPGGKVEKDDPDATFTALREAEEEIGLRYDEVSVIGHLPRLITVTQFYVTPILAFVDPNYRPSIDANEVDTLFEVPLAFLVQPKNMSAMQFTVRGKSHRVLSIPYNEHFIWGVTAQIIESLQTQMQPS
ncbi:putative Nudix hydrolase NudL [Vibrio thalassae]|uniref:Putative Nudix hydrolase NudL n=1 Tax=Vibrio thalassae TaxID=1243014 RepID=A0A240ELX6_9VIBR|nr:CoA pyrophosphatase [Vibrio thalassae]SNX48970.1 putative Nudix hydrolase NudL [Vibrio thalassae]